MPLVAGIVIVCVLFFGGMVWLLTSIPADPGRTTGGSETTAQFSDAASPSVGPTDTRVVVRVYGDYQCPACKIAEAGLKPTITVYKDRVRFVWKDFPLPNHRHARAAAVAARCAEQQGRFLEYHDRLYQEQQTWSALASSREVFDTYAKAVGIDLGRFQLCVDAPQGVMSLIDADVREGTRNGVQGTPTFYINQHRVSAMSPQEWAKQLDAALALRVAPISNP